MQTSQTSSASRDLGRGTKYQGNGTFPFPAENRNDVDETDPIYQVTSWTIINNYCDTRTYLEEPTLTITMGDKGDFKDKQFAENEVADKVVEQCE
jgi:hypothetical protein